MLKTSPADETYYEGEQTTLTCRMRSVEGCRETLSALANRTQLGSFYDSFWPSETFRSLEGDMTNMTRTVMRDEDDTGVFSVVYSLQANFSEWATIFGFPYAIPYACMATNDNSLMIVSKEVAISNVERRFRVEMANPTIKARVDQEFALVCHFSDPLHLSPSQELIDRAAELIHWSRKSDAADDWEDADGIISLPTTTSTKFDPDDEDLVRKDSVLTVTLDEAWTGFYKCAVNGKANPYAFEATARVTVVKEVVLSEEIKKKQLEVLTKQSKVLDLKLKLLEKQCEVAGCNPDKVERYESRNNQIISFNFDVH